jgi:hypothetical protein
MGEHGDRKEKLKKWRRSKCEKRERINKFNVLTSVSHQTLVIVWLRILWSLGINFRRICLTLNVTIFRDKRRVVRTWIDVWKERMSSILKVENQPSKKTVQQVPSHVPLNRQFTYRLRSAISQKIATFITTAVRTLNPTCLNLFSD